MKTIKALFCISAFMLAINTADAGDTDFKKAAHINLVLKIKSLISNSDYAADNNIQGEYIITYRVNENSKIEVIKIKGEDKNMERDIFQHLQGKKIKMVDDHNVKVIKVDFHTN